jgi:hypothetical protein
MRYTVTWEPTAERQLANLWVHALDRQAVADASDRIESALKVDAQRKGRRVGRFRAYGVDPLEMLFFVNPGDCMVRIIQVRRVN